ncbi:MAG: hypothetical protein ABIO04_08420 [Ferruginibacter sp.]
MHLANLTTAWFKRIFGLLIFLSIFSFVSAQENSPYSRYGIGDIVPNQNIVSRGMGGISAAYTDYRSINLINPAAIGNTAITIFDVGGEIDIRTLKSNSSPEKFRATNTLISYLQLAFPISSAKMKRRGNSWGLTFGLRPVSRISYKIEKIERIQLLPNFNDSLSTINEGSGGLNQINIGTAIRIKNLSFGINTGYSFGNKDYSTRKSFLNDTVIYYQSNTETQVHFSGLFLNLGAQYTIKLAHGTLGLGAYGNLQQDLKAKTDNFEGTFTYDGNGGTVTIDTVAYTKDIKGTVKVPATYGGGFNFYNKHWLFGVDFETTNWNSYRSYGQKEAVQDNWTIRAGAQYFPAKDNTPSGKYWSFVRYRAGFYYGNDYIKLDKNRPAYAVTIGASFPLVTSVQHTRFGDYVMLNTGFEFGAKGNRQTQSVRENITRINIGISMNARWFQKRSFD